MPSGCQCLCGKAQPGSLDSRAQRARGRKQEHPGGLLVGRHVGSLPCFRSPAFLPGCHHSCKALMSLEAQRTSYAGRDLLCQERGSCRSGNSWAAESVLTLWSGGAQHALVIWEAAPGMQAVHGLISECQDPTRAVQAPCTCRILEGNTCVPPAVPPLGAAPMLVFAPLISQSWYQIADALPELHQPSLSIL